MVVNILLCLKVTLTGFSNHKTTHTPSVLSSSCTVEHPVGLELGRNIDLNTDVKISALDVCRMCIILESSNAVLYPYKLHEFSLLYFCVFVSNFVLIKCVIEIKS